MMLRRLLPPCGWFLVLGLAASPRARADAAPPDPGTPPQQIHDDVPAYPASLAGTGLRGNVLLIALVDPAGKVSQVEVLESAHPDFEASAVKTALTWTFRPATRNGKAVQGRYIYTSHFVIADPSDLIGGSLPGAEVLHFPRLSPATLPSQFFYDQPPVPTLLTAPVYPLDLLERHVEGSATVTYAIDPKGRTHLFRVDNATDPEFAAATTAMVLSWEFNPARLGGRATWALVNRKETFERDEGDFPVSTVAQSLARELGRNPCPIPRGGFDRAPIVRFGPRMKVPEALVKARAPASAVVEIVVDEAGHAQLPRVVAATDADFGWAAVTAVARWVYDPLTQNGKPVAGFVQIPFNYTPKPAPKAT